MKTKCECRRARPSDHRGVIFFVDSFKLHINNKAEPRKTLYISLSVDVFLGLISFKLLYGDHNVSPGDHKPNKKHLPGAARPLDTNSARPFAGHRRSVHHAIRRRTVHLGRKF